VIYLAPIKALCQERYDDWKNRFEELGRVELNVFGNLECQYFHFGIGINCYELTGDTDSQVDYRVLSKQDIIFTTPEKWDSVTRKWKEINFFLKVVALIVIDEVHLLNESRGATLEAVVSRMKMINEERQKANSHKIRY